jgi:predicted transcriptional regulator
MSLITEFDDSRQEFRRLLWFLLSGSRGGPNRAKILSAIRDRPRNLNQLAKVVGVDYRSIQHHIGILVKNSLIIGTGKRYGMVYSIHPWLEHHMSTFDEVCERLGFRQSYYACDNLGSVESIPPSLLIFQAGRE